MRKLKPIRIRFTVRLLFVATAVLAVALYVLYVRPTSIAQRFVAAIMSHDFSAAKSLVVGEGLSDLDDETAHVDRFYAEVLPREWDDIRKCQRRVIFRVVRHDVTEGRRIDWTADTDLIARINGVEKAKSVINLSNLQPTTIQMPGAHIPDYTLLP